MHANDMSNTVTHYWITCPTCVGPQQVTQRVSGMTFGCRGCNRFVTAKKFRSVTTPRLDSRRSVRPCNGQCINGKTSCDCKCRGKCHGADTCYCNDPVGA